MPTARLFVRLAVLFHASLALGGMPPASQPRAERMNAWRETLAAADEARVAGRDEVAERLYVQVVEAAAGTGERNLLVARALDGWGDLCRRAGRYPEARTHYLESAGMWERMLGPDQPRLATTLHNLAVVEWRLGEPAAARSHLSRALAIWEASLGPESPEAENSRAFQREIRSSASRLPEPPSPER
jgi:hypothetical protein